jgi:hypothetical protein
LKATFKQLVRANKTMRVHVVRPLDGWVLQRTGDLLLTTMESCVSVSESSRSDVDLNFYCNYALLGAKSGTLDVPWFTHMPASQDDDGWRRQLFLGCIERADFCIAQSKETASHLPADRTGIWHGLPIITVGSRPLRIGVCATPSRRKRLDRLDAFQCMKGVEVHVTGGALNEEQMRVFYQSIDYLIVTSDTEGGPIPVLEALAAGIPVIAPNVGFCWEYPVIRYEDISDLVRIIETLRSVPINTRWSSGAAMLENIVSNVFHQANSGGIGPMLDL